MKGPRLFIFIGLLLAAAAVLGWFLGRSARSPRVADVSVQQPPAASPTPKPGRLVDQPHDFPPADALRCAKCHAEIFAEWRDSQHARANRLVDEKDIRGAFAVAAHVNLGGQSVSISVDNGRPTLKVGDATYEPQAVIGVEPLYQFLVPLPGGRWQAFNPGFDPARREWFDIFAGENRQPHDWGYWRNRGMNWNSQCAVCHMTDFRKNYDVTSDSYDSKWAAMGISCAQCHPGSEAHLKSTAARPARLSPERIESNCASCHSRRVELTGNFRAGEDYFDHYRPALADVPGVFQPDGQVRDEDFEYGSFLMSRMHHKGVSCLNCHHPHSGKLVLPIENNALCLSCHAPPGANGATPIVAAQHMFHRDGVPGGRCVDCHMAQNWYMQRDPRRDHGFVTPDPLLTKQIGVPNACNRCHSDRSADWAVEWTNRWYGEKMNRRSRARALAVQRAQRQDATVLPELVALAASEETAGWKATLAGLLAPWSAEPSAAEILRRFAKDAHPAVRGAAVRALGPNAPVTEALADASRLVRLDAFEAVPEAGMKHQKVRGEFLEFLRATHDQPGGAMAEAQFALVENRPADAERWARKAAEWDDSAGTNLALARILVALGKPGDAEAAMRRALELEPANGQTHFMLALLLAEQGRLPESISALQRAVEAEPSFGRAWYNLGLAQSQAGDADSALASLSRAAALLPDSAEPSFAQATILANLGRKDEARSAARESLKRNPAFQPASQLLNALGVP